MLSPRRILLAVSTATLMVLTTATSQAYALPKPPPSLVPMPTIADDFPDPVVREYNGTYYAFATGSSAIHIQSTTSPDGVTWTPIVEALPTMATWADPKPSYTWAPYVWRFGSAYVMYYATRDKATKHQCISYAVASSPGGPYSDTTTGPLVCPHNLAGAIDPSIFIAVDAVPYLLYKADVPTKIPSTLWSIKLTPDGRSTVGSPSLLMTAEPGWEDNIIEAPSMVFDGQRYELFYSANHWDTAAYASGIARCDSPVGPCFRTTNGPILTDADGKFGPGGVETFRDENKFLGIVYHAWTPGRIGYGLTFGARQMWIESLTFQFGIPIVGGRTSNPPSENRVAAIIASPTGAGYERIYASGRVLNSGDFTSQSFDGPYVLVKPIVGAARSASGQGAWYVAADGGVFAVNGAGFFGSTGGISLNQPIVGMASTPTGNGYWLVAADGGIFSFGDAKFYGSMGATPLNKPVVGLASTPTGNGYWLVAADGGIFSFGDAKFFGSMGATPLNKPIVGMASSAQGNGYVMVASDGGLFTFGDAVFAGSTGGVNVPSPIVGMAPTPSGNGYWLAAASGRVYAFGDAPNLP